MHTVVNIEIIIVLHTCQFAAHEHRAWLLYYSIPVLLGVLDLEYIRHLALLVEALWLLLQSSISPEDITHADELLFQFCKKFGSLYGKYSKALDVIDVCWAHAVSALMSSWLGKKRDSKYPPVAPLY